MPALFSRTSTHKVLELYLEFKTLDVAFLTDKLNQRGHNRRVNDVRTMLKHLMEVGIVGNVHGERLVEIVRGIREPENPSPAEIYVSAQLIDFLMEHGLAVMPFLKAVKDYPNRNKMIQIKMVSYGPDYGFYNLREGDDVSAAMGNFFSFLGFLKNREKGKKGRYELTALGRKLVGDRDEEIIKRRVKCDHGEPCREVCPANAIAFDRITDSCIECGLCTKACPYGAITLDCTGKIKMDTDVCFRNCGEQHTDLPCDISPIRAEELVMQNWLKSLFILTELPAEIPGTGEYPDIVTAEVPSFVEVKKDRISEKRMFKLLNDQLPRYMDDEIINRTLERIKSKNKNFKPEKPEFFVVIAPTSKYVASLLENAEDMYGSVFKFPVSFVPFEDLYEASVLMLKGKKINLKEDVWEKIEPWKENKFFLK